MTYKEALTITANILEEVKNPDNWTAELFERVRDAPYFNVVFPEYGCINNKIRQALPEEIYYLFDTAYCHYIKTGQVPGFGLACKLFREGAGGWKMRKRILLKIKRNLLMKKSA